MTAASKRLGAKNKTQPKRPLCKQVLAAPVTAQWPFISEAQILLIKRAVQEAAGELKDRKRLQPPWRELKKVPKDKRAEFIEEFEEKYLASLDLPKREAFLKTKQTRKAKLTEIVFGYNEIMRHLSKGALAAVLVNKSATPEFLAKSFLPGCYCHSIPVVAIENLQEVFGKCIGVGFKESVKEEGSSFHAMYTLMQDVTDNSARSPQPSTTSLPSLESNASSPSARNNLKPLKKMKVPPPVVDVSRFHLIRGSPEQAAFFSKLSNKQWSCDVISLSADIPGKAKNSTSFDFRKKKQFGRPIKENSSPALGECDVTEHQESSCAKNFSEDVVFELDYGGDSEDKTDGERASPVASQEATEEEFAESPTRKSSTMQRSDFATEVQKTKTMKRKAREVEEKLTGAFSYVPAAVMRVVGNPKRKKFNNK
ncbi:50S ribosomal protein L30e-like [Trinorchestia longiramus]|nr:50S ribosomal protein L30e-like [Trinorchestia longiramus]